MHSARVVFLMLLFALAAVSAFAQACPPVSTCPSNGCPTITCPAVETCPAVPQEPVCPAVGAGPAVVTTPVCPAPVAEVPVCPAPVAAEAPTCPPIQFQACPGACQTPMVTAPSCAIAAGVGGGPLSILTTTPAGPGFDRVYVENMYQAHSDLIALTTQGSQRVTDDSLRKLSEKITAEQTDQNRKLAMWYTDMGCGALPTGACPTSDVVNCLCGVAAGSQFDIVYAQTLMDTLTALRANALVGQSKLYNDEIRHQAGLVARVSDNEIIALQRWMNDRGIAPATAYTGYAVPSTYAAGPATQSQDYVIY